MISVGRLGKLKLSSYTFRRSLKYIFLTFSVVGLISYVLFSFLSTSRVPVLAFKTRAKIIIQDGGQFSNVLFKERLDSYCNNHGLQNTDKIQSQTNKANITHDGIRIEQMNQSRTTERNIDKTDVIYEVNIFRNSIFNDDKRRKHSCSSCFKHDFNYVIQNENICQKMFFGQDIDLLILITTTHQNIKARSALRDTWLSHSKNNTANVRYVFLLGETEDVKDRSAIKEENNIFHDIVKEDFVDSYANLTYKTIMGFKWASTKCVDVKHVMKTDDDMFVNVPNLIQTINDSLKDKLNSTVVGYCHQTAAPVRDRNSKWFASIESYPEDIFPGYCSGTGYVTSLCVVTKVYKISANIPFFHLEDVYVSLCIKQLGFHLQLVFGFNVDRPELDPCVYHGKKLITSHQMSPEMIRQVWQEKCSTPD